MFFPWCLALSLTVLICSVNLGYAATLATDEVDALQQIAKTLGKKDWNFTMDPCSREPSWFIPNKNTWNNQLNQVICNCSFNSNTACHVIHIRLTRQNLSGIVPPELDRLPYLQTIDLGFNYLNGTIPPEWGTMQKLQYIFLNGNRVMGQIPRELANISTLSTLDLECNQLSGNIPPEFGNFSSIEYISLSSNYLSGELPDTLERLTTLTDFAISDNNFSGKIPEFIGSWTSIEQLDLSFNKLSGPIPDNFSPPSNITNIYLTGNLLTGPVPTWMQQNGEIKIGIVSCLRSVGCKQKYYSLHINCGGGKVKDDDDGTPYEEDTATGGASNFERSWSNWGFSSTGHFIDIDTSLYIKANTSSISGKNPQLYMNARVSPLSLSYYGFCLGKGNYTISLHFAEIVFTRDRTYNSLGRRLFDVYIQGKLMLKDFNIEDEADGGPFGRD